jgi:hypothetical protein
MTKAKVVEKKQDDEITLTLPQLWEVRLATLQRELSRIEGERLRIEGAIAEIKHLKELSKGE